MTQDPNNCYHCATPIPKGVDLQLEVNGEAQHFCCPACRAVTQTIIDSGFDRFYQHRDQQGANSQRPEDRETELQLFDAETVQQQFVRPLADGNREASLVIEGISCAACVWLLEKHIGAQPGVQSFNVNLTNHRARLVWHPEQAKLSQLMASVVAIGYTPHPYHPNKEEQLYELEKKRATRRLGVAGVGMMQVMMMAAALYLGAVSEMESAVRNFIRWTSFIVATPVVLYAARPFFIAAIRDIKTRHLSMDVPVSIAIAGAYLASIWATVTDSGEVYFDSVSMFTFFLLVGRYFEMMARHRTGMAGNALANLLPASAIRLGTDGQQSLIPANELQPGDRVLVKPGHSVPADGILFSEQTSVDESALTGEPLPVSRFKGDALVGGTLNVEQAIEMEVTATGDQSRMSAILNLLDRAQSEKPQVARIADRVASYFVAAVLLTALVVSLSWWLIEPADALWVTLSVLVVTCPCALSLATPTALTAAVGTLREKGLLVTRGHVLESLAQATLIAFDKTGTLTTGQLTLRDTLCLGKQTETECQQIAAALESHSEHPIAQAFSPYFTMPPEQTRIIIAQGVEGQVAGQTYRIGKPEFAAELFAAPSPAKPDLPGIWLLLASNQGPLCWFGIDDQVRSEAQETLAQLRAAGLKTLMLTGDHHSNAQRIGTQLGLDSVEADLSPEQKLARVKALQQQGEQIIMVGDGINDIPVLSGAQTSVAMSSATDLAKTSADAVLINSDLRNLASALKLARRTRQVIRQNIGWALIYNLIALPLAATGHIAPWMAAIGMSASSLVVVGNALRLTRQK